jgi:hypothetical protein
VENAAYLGQKAAYLLVGHVQAWESAFRRWRSPMDWSPVVDAVMPSVVHIATPDGNGTGFLCFYSKSKTIAMVATAAHVVEHAHEWNQPLKINHISSKSATTLEFPKRRIFIDPSGIDSAVVLFEKEKLKLPDDLPELLSGPLRIGVEVGWLGFPHIAPLLSPCFFCGNVSAHVAEKSSYLIDGVAIHGVSGGPVFIADADGRPKTRLSDFYKSR